jgi:hypothetical protein
MPARPEVLQILEMSGFVGVLEVLVTIGETAKP